MKNTDFSEIHSAMVNRLDKALTNVAKDDISIFELTKLTQSISKPTLLLETNEIKVEQNNKGSAGIVWLQVNYQAHCILPGNTGSEKVDCLDFASVVIKTVNQNTWGLPNVATPTLMTGFPSYHTSNLAGIESFVVSWWQRVAVDSHWTLSRPPADHVFISQAPEIGKAHADKYEKL